VVDADGFGRHLVRLRVQEATEVRDELFDEELELEGTVGTWARDCVWDRVLHVKTGAGSSSGGD
jgi:hypothetical protein